MWWWKKIIMMMHPDFWFLYHQTYINIMMSDFWKVLDNNNQFFLPYFTIIFIPSNRYRTVCVCVDVKRNEKRVWTNAHKELLKRWSACIIRMRWFKERIQFVFIVFSILFLYTLFRHENTKDMLLYDTVTMIWKKILFYSFMD